MQFVNGTDGTIELEPGEGISFGATVRAVEGDIFRIVATDEAEPQPVDELMSAREIMDRKTGRHDGGDD